MLLISTSSSTALLNLDPEMGEAEFSDKIASQLTLAAGLLPGGNTLVQVTRRDVNLWSDVAAGTSIAVWDVGQDQEIIAAQAQGDMVVIAKRGGELVILNATETGGLESIV